MRAVILAMSILLVGCAPLAANKDQLILKVPPELLEKAEPLKQL